MSHPDHFELFGLPPRYAIDLDALERAYKEVQAHVHPDRYASGTAAERRVAMQWATRANDAYTTLRSPQKRAAYLVERAGVPINAETNTAMPPAFLMQQMEWREALDEARGDPEALSEARATMNDERDELLAAIGTAIDDAQDWTRAAALVRQLMFIDRFASEIGHADEAAHARPASA
ncbi:MAG TPA: Fe-S protein assembly co-chaperone HscB [Burkholderiaceae bacterium]|nr:Fe-S protein assembly co-chaperone HscB [Burkholderiaceae bacterium]